MTQASVQATQMSTARAMARRLWRVSEPVWDGECLRWTGNHNPDGYGRFGGSATRMYAHRLFWVLMNGPLQDGLTLDHVYDRGCRFTDCIRITHLEPVSRSENTRRNRINRLRRTRTHCVNAHEWTPESTRIAPNGARECRRCSNISATASHRRSREVKKLAA